MNHAADVDRARRWIEDQIEALGALRNAGTRDPVFKQWRQNTLTVIQRIWPGDPVRGERFRRVPFSPPSNRADAKTTREFYERGCAEAMALLRGLVAEIELEGVPAANSAPDPASLEPGVAEDDFPTLDLPGGPAPSASAPAKGRAAGSGAPRLGIPPVTPAPRESDPRTERERPRAPRQSEKGRGPARGAKGGRKSAKPRLKDMLGFGDEEASRGREESRQGPPPLPERTSGPGPDFQPSEPPESLLDELRADPPPSGKGTMPDLASWIGEELANARQHKSAPEPDSAPPFDPDSFDPSPFHETPADEAPHDEPAPEQRPFEATTFFEPLLSESRLAEAPADEEQVADELEAEGPQADELEAEESEADELEADELEAEELEAEELEAEEPDLEEPVVEIPVVEEPRAAARPPAPAAEPAEEAEEDASVIDVARAMDDFLRHSPVFSAKPRPVDRKKKQAPVPVFDSPAALAVAALAADVGSLDVPEGQRAGARAALLDLARRIETHDLTWDDLRDAVQFAMEFPAIGRRVLPLLVPYLDQAA
jgi:hypothetical protein